MDDLRERFFLLALQHLFSTAPLVGARLLQRAGSARALFEGDRSLFESSFGAQRALWETFLHFEDWESIERAEGVIESREARVIALTDDRYPSLLREIHDPPAVLTVIGEEEAAWDRPLVAMVGSRIASRHALEVAARMAEGLALEGIGVASGMAYGVDAASHRGALAGGGPTIAVLGCGVDVAYPADHRSLAHAIAKQGLIISEFPPGTEPYPANFPQRNRIVSGLSLASVVVEATERSGSLITARFALEQGREVFAVPGLAGTARARGVHRLIRDGAALVESAGDVVELLKPLLEKRSFFQKSGQLKVDVAKDSALFAALESIGEGSVDALVAATGLPASRLLPELTLMALAGIAEELPGGRWRMAKKKKRREEKEDLVRIAESTASRGV